MQDKLFVVVAMMDGPFVQPLHSFIKFASSGRTIMPVHWGVPGGDWGLCGTSRLDWKEAKPVERLDDTSEITSFYDDGYNRMKFFDPAGPGAEVKETGVWVPKMPSIPAEVAFVIATTPTTPWELHQHLCNYKENRGPAVKTMLKKAKIWAIVASCKGGT